MFQGNLLSLDPVTIVLVSGPVTTPGWLPGLPGAPPDVDRC